MSEKNSKKAENLRKMINDLDRKIEKLQHQKKVYELSLQEFEDSTENKNT